MTDDNRIEALERRLAVLEDKDEIRRLRDDYHGCINDGRFDEIVDLCTDDAHVELGYLAIYVGRDAIDAGFRGMGTRERFYINNSSTAIGSTLMATTVPAPPILKRVMAALARRT